MDGDLVPTESRVRHEQRARNVPPFDEQSALRKVQLAQDAWNTADPAGVALAYTEDSRWRNRDELFQGRDAIRAFLERKWARELDHCLHKEL